MFIILSKYKYPDSVLIVGIDFNLLNSSWVNSDTHSLIDGIRSCNVDILHESVVLLELFQLNYIKNQHLNIWLYIT